VAIAIDVFKNLGRHMRASGITGMFGAQLPGFSGTGDLTVTV
jgi:hypothetical protein